MDHVSLLPPRVREKRVSERRQAVLIRVMIAFFILVLVAYAFLLVSSMLARSNINTLRTERESLQMQINSLQPYADLYDQMNRSESRLNQAMGNAPSWNDLLHDLGITLTPGTWLSDLNMNYNGEEGSFSLRGWAFSHDNISEMIDHLQSMEQLRDIRLQIASETELDGSNVIQFAVEAGLQPGELYLQNGENGAGEEETENESEEEGS
jgi:Tfp pilus assembly protein PilN